MRHRFTLPKGSSGCWRTWYYVVKTLEADHPQIATRPLLFGACDLNAIVNKVIKKAIDRLAACHTIFAER
jgi:hypothetical protein